MPVFPLWPWKGFPHWHSCSRKTLRRQLWLFPSLSSFPFFSISKSSGFCLHRHLDLFSVCTFPEKNVASRPTTLSICFLHCSLYDLFKNFNWYNKIPLLKTLQRNETFISDREEITGLILPYEITKKQYKVRQGSYLSVHRQMNGVHGMLCVLSCVWLFVTLWAIAHQAPLSMEFSRQEYWSGVAISYSRGPSWPTDWTHVSCVLCIGRWILYHCHHLGSPYGTSVQFSSVQLLSHVRLFATHESQHARPPCPSPAPRVYSNSCA